MTAWELFKKLTKINNLTNRPDLFEVEFCLDGKSYSIQNNVSITITDDYPMKFKLLLNSPTNNELDSFNQFTFDDAMSGGSNDETYKI